MSQTDETYAALLNKLLHEGELREDRTGTGTYGLFGYQMRFDLREEFPLLTTKRVHWKSVVEELLWMLSGSTNNNDLRKRGVTIWDEWAKPDGDLGPIYGKQWRDWSGVASNGLSRRVDQIQQVISDIKTNPFSRRHVVSAWNPVDLPEMGLHPCHCLFQFHVSSDGYLSCQLYQRSSDVFLGVPFNIASYALLTHMIAQLTELKPGDFIWTGGDVHLYTNHVEQAKIQLAREGRAAPAISLNHHIDAIKDFRPDDIHLVGYDPHPSIRAEVSV